MISSASSPIREGRKNLRPNHYRLFENWHHLRQHPILDRVGDAFPLLGAARLRCPFCGPNFLIQPSSFDSVSS